MIRIVYCDGTPVEPTTVHMNTVAAERRAVNILGSDWRERGYRIEPVELKS